MCSGDPVLADSMNVHVFVPAFAFSRLVEVDLTSLEPGR